MGKINKESVVCVEASTPQALGDALNELKKKAKSRFVAMNIYGPHVLVRQFDYPRVTIRELKNALLLEAVELLHIPAEQIEIDYQLMIHAPDKMKGLFIAAPKSLIDEYLEYCDAEGFTPVAMTASMITRVESFLNNNNVTHNSFCLLDFCSENRIHLAAFETDNCVLMREIRYEDPEEIEQEVMNSLRYSTARSSLKQFNEIYLSGAAGDTDGLMARLEKEFDVKPKRGDFTDGTLRLSQKKPLFRLNLLKKYALNFSGRKAIVQTVGTLVLAAFVLCAAAGIKVMDQDKTIKGLKKSFTEFDYLKAKDLRKKTEALDVQ